MVKENEFWNLITEEVKEYLSLRYYSITRCLLTDEQKLHISRNEVKYMNQKEK